MSQDNKDNTDTVNLGIELSKSTLIEGSTEVKIDTVKAEENKEEGNKAFKG